MSERILNVANTVVLEKENERILKLMENAEQMFKRAETCKCLNCWKDFRRVDDILQEELDRLME